MKLFQSCSDEEIKSFVMMEHGALERTGFLGSPVPTREELEEVAELAVEEADRVRISSNRSCRPRPRTAAGSA